MPGSPVSTQGTDRIVKTKTVTLAAGVEQEILPALAKSGIYRVVGAQITMNGAGSAFAYYGPNASDTNIIAGGTLVTGVPLVAMMGDWAPQAGLAGQPISADVAGAAATIVLHYIEISDQQ